jgi:hypothetical protein
MIDAALVVAVLIVLVVVLAGIAIAPTVGLSFYLASNRRDLRTNLVAGVLSSMLGLVAGGWVFDPIARTPPQQAYLVVGAWLGGALGVVVATTSLPVACPQSIAHCRRSTASFSFLPLYTSSIPFPPRKSKNGLPEWPGLRAPVCYNAHRRVSAEPDRRALSVDAP